MSQTSHRLKLCGSSEINSFYELKLSNDLILNFTLAMNHLKTLAHLVPTTPTVLHIAVTKSAGRSVWLTIAEN